MKKTIEEVKKCVLAYCGEVCPQHMLSTALWGNLKMFRDSETFEIMWGDRQWMVINQYSSDDAFIAAYRLLGLSERDAIDAERAKSAQLVAFAKKIADLFSGKGMGNEATEALEAYDQK